MHCLGIRLTRFLVLKQKGCLFPLWPPENYRDSPGQKAEGTLDPLSSRGSCSVLQTPGM